MPCVRPQAINDMEETIPVFNKLFKEYNQSILEEAIKQFLKLYACP